MTKGGTKVTPITTKGDFVRAGLASPPGISLRCVGLTKSFDGTVALRDVHLDFPLSGIVAIIGPNGAGKTTLLHVLTGFLRPEAGKVFLGDRELTRLPAHQIARLGIARTFQDLRLISRVSVLENVMLARPAQKGGTFLVRPVPVRS